MAAVWAKVSEAAKRQAGVEVPERVVQHMRNAFAVLAQPKKKGLLFEVPRLIFDSLWQPVSVGVRSAAAAAAAPRQFLYQAGHVVIDIRMETKPNTDQVWLDGQVMDSALKGKGLELVPVQIMSGLDKLVETNTNNFGEFHVEYKAAKSLRVSLGISEKKNIFIPLDEWIWRNSSKIN